MPAVIEPIPAPDLQGGEWLNSAPLALAGLRGQAVLVHFWDYAGVNCLRTLPYLQAWAARYAAVGFTLIGVHSPQFPFARISDNVRAAVERLGIGYPVLLDSDHRTWNAWANRIWPAHYLVGPEGDIWYFHYGEGDYLGIEAQIQIMLRHIHPEAALPPLLPPLRASDEPGAAWLPATRDIYLGAGRGRLGNPESGVTHAVVDYAEYAPHMPDALYAVGCWEHTPDALRLVRESGALAVRYHAREVYAVICPPTDTRGIIEVEQDGAPLPLEARGSDLAHGREPVLTVEMPRAYHLVANPAIGPHELRLRVRTPGTAVYVLNFIPDVSDEADTRAA